MGAHRRPRWQADPAETVRRSLHDVAVTADRPATLASHVWGSIAGIGAGHRRSTTRSRQRAIAYSVVAITCSAQRAL